MKRLPTIAANGVPFCSREKCPKYDGKRCFELGSRPDRICEPEVIDIARGRDMVFAALDGWDWDGLVRDAKRGDFDSAADALASIARVDAARKAS